MYRYLFVLGLCLLGRSAIAADAPVTLDRSAFIQTFSDEFTTFDWYNPDPATRSGKPQGIWTTNFLFRPNNIDDVGNRTLTNNAEQQIYVDRGFKGTGLTSLHLDPFSTQNGRLIITADKAPASALPYLSGYRYTSGLITTRKSFTQEYGLFEIRARLPKGRGLWPAFWLMPVDGSWPPEIDVMEILEDNPTTLYTSVHTHDTDQGNPTITTIIADSTTDFHTYSVDWESDQIVFYVDDHEVGRKPTPSDLHKPMYLLANLAVGGKWPGNPDATTHFPARFEIEWIRAYRRRDAE
jgi:beta-glucanase (GH16 family)